MKSKIQRHKSAFCNLTEVRLVLVLATLFETTITSIDSHDEALLVVAYKRFFARVPYPF